MSQRPLPAIQIGPKTIGLDHPTYFIADVAANHDGDLDRAKDLIFLAAEAGADAAKFQHFRADTIVSDFGFRNLGDQLSHQATWKKSVFEVYQDASLKFDWTPVLKETCDKAGVAFFTSPYSLELVDAVDPFIPAYKVGSGDITWTGILERIAAKGKPVLLSTGASTADEVRGAVDTILRLNRQLLLLQCNTNYAASVENFKYIQLNVLKTYQEMFPDMVLGLSDHTPGHATVLGAVALGARAIEKHFTDDTGRTGPDHGFSMDPRTWRDMVDGTRELERALGAGVKQFEDNERDTVVLQRRAIRARRNLAKGSRIGTADVEVLRPCPVDGLPPYRLPEVIDKILVRDLKSGEHIRWRDLN